MTNFPLQGKWSVFICVAAVDGGVPGVVGFYDSCVKGQARRHPYLSRRAC